MLGADCGCNVRGGCIVGGGRNVGGGREMGGGGWLCGPLAFIWEGGRS